MYGMQLNFLNSEFFESLIICKTFDRCDIWHMQHLTFTDATHNICDILIEKTFAKIKK